MVQAIMRTPLGLIFLSIALAVIVAAIIATMVFASPGDNTRVSVASDGTQANNISLGPSISSDGRFVAFQSLATNLVPGDTNNQPDVFVHDRQTGLTTRVSVATGGAQGDRYSGAASISGDGRYVAFESQATNLVPGDLYGIVDVFVHDRVSGQTTKVSVACDGTQASDLSAGPSISADGRYVAFTSLPLCQDDVRRS